jgi:hypothetical protein
MTYPVFEYGTGVGNVTAVELVDVEKVFQHSIVPSVYRIQFPLALDPES